MTCRSRAALACLLIAATANAESILVPTIEETAAITSRIARVRIVSATELTYSKDGERAVCGRIYLAEPIEVSKGSAEPLQFFDAHITAGPGEETFVMISEWRETPEIDVAFGECLNRGSSAGYIASEHSPFDPAAGRQFGGLWIRQGPIYLYSIEDLGERRVDAAMDQTSHKVIRWDRVRAIVLKALHRS